MKNKFEYFNNFVNESVVMNKVPKNLKDDKIKIVLLSNISEDSYTVPAVEKECKKRGLKFVVIDVNTSSLNSLKNGNLLLADNKTSIEIDSDNTAILTRRGIVKNTHTRDIVERLEDSNFFVVNTLESVLNCENKYITAKILENNGISTPRTALINGEDSIQKAVKEIGGKYPVVLKMLSGSHGIGVSIIESESSLKSVLQTLWKVDPDIETLIQEKIESDHDLRIHVLTKRFNSPKPDDSDSMVIGCMRRNKINKDFRTNYSLGGTVEGVEITKEQEELAINAAKSVGCNWAGVDIIVDKKTKKNYVLEVNSSPGTQGLKNATGIDVVKIILDFLEDKKNWIRNRRVIGFREVVNIPKIGDLVAKFDTGNGALSCSLTYDELSISDDKKVVSWSINGKKFKNDIIGISNAEVGSEIHERPIIELDVNFMGKLYKNVAVSLVDRTDKSTKFLVNRNFMERIGASISPYKTFIVTSFTEDYNPKKSKGDKHSGIVFEDFINESDKNQYNNITKDTVAWLFLLKVKISENIKLNKDDSIDLARGDGFLYRSGIIKKIGDDGSFADEKIAIKQINSIKDRWIKEIEKNQDDYVVRNQVMNNIKFDDIYVTDSVSTFEKECDKRINNQHQLRNIKYQMNRMVDYIIREYQQKHAVLRDY